MNETGHGIPLYIRQDIVYRYEQGRNIEQDILVFFLTREIYRVMCGDNTSFVTILLYI